MKLKSDEFSLYIKIGLHIFRPVPSKFSYQHEKATTWASTFTEDSRVNASHITDTPFCRINNETAIEIWHSHGEFDKVSTNSWNPV